LGTRNGRIIRGNNRDSSGINGEFLCVKGRYGFDFYDHPERLQAPLARVDGKLTEVSWARALESVAGRFNQTLAAGGSFGIVGSNHTTNEENYYLQKFARQVLRTDHIDHHRTGDLVTLLDALSGKPDKLATVADLDRRKAVLILGADLALEHPLLSFQIRANYRHHAARIYALTPKPVREDKYAFRSVRAGRPEEYFAALESLRGALGAEAELVALFDDSVQGEDIGRLVEFAESLGIPVKYICLLDYSNSRGALDMGLLPDLLPGYAPAERCGMRLDEMLEAELDVLWVVGSNPLKGVAGAQSPSQSGDREGAVAPAGAASDGRRPSKARFLVVQDMFLTETGSQADVVLPAASAYEKSGTVTNITGEVQRLKRAVEVMGAKPDLEIMGFLAREMGAAAALGPWVPETVFEEIRARVRGYNVPMAVVAAGGAAQAMPVNGRIPADVLRAQEERGAHSVHNGLFASGTLGRYSKVLNSVLESRLDR
jgi:NADH-quinone oxidoreductase subunit G